MSDMALRLHFGGESMFNRVPAEENQAESAHKVPKMTLTMAELADELQRWLDGQPPIAVT